MANGIEAIEEENDENSKNTLDFQKQMKMNQTEEKIDIFDNDMV